MLTLPVEFTRLMMVFAPLFSWRVWQHAQVLLVGAILAPGKRTVTAALRGMGLSQTSHFQNYHRVLNRAAWSSRQASHLLLVLLVQTFAPFGPLGALSSAKRPTSQKADRLGPADAPAGTPLVPQTSFGWGRGQQLCYLRIAPLLPGLGPPHYLHHPPAVGCGSLCASPTGAARAERPATAEGNPAAHPGSGAGQPRNLLDPGESPWVVWRAGTDGGNRLGCRSLVSYGPTAGPHPLGPGTRPFG